MLGLRSQNGVSTFYMAEYAAEPPLHVRAGTTTAVPGNKLTLNAGLRYEDASPNGEQHALTSSDPVNRRR